MKLFILLSLSFMSLSVSAQQTCYVDMIDRYNRVVSTFTAFDNPSVCYEAMKQCRKAIRFSPHLGGVDCVKEAARAPIPQPRPHQPAPQPRPRPHQPVPQPSPYPRPQPIPHYSVDGVSLGLDIASAESSSEHKTKMLNEFLMQINSPSLSTFVRICESTRTWYENSQCLVNGMNRAPRESISEQDAIYAVGAACKKSSTWFSEKSCYANAFKGGRLESLNYYAQSCSQMYDSQSAVNCYRQIFGIQ